MSERDPRDVPETRPIDASGTASEASGTASEALPPPAPQPRAATTDPLWAVPSPANLMNGPTVPIVAPSPGMSSGGLPPAPGSAAGGAVGRPGPGSRRGLLVAAGAGAAVLLAGAGFVVGTQFGGGHDSTRLVSVQGSGPGNGYGFGHGDGDDGAMGRGGPGQGMAALATAGRITAVSGSTLTLSTFRGGTAQVTTTSSTTVDGTSGGKVSALSVGQLVFVAGSKASDGSYQATAIMTRHDRSGGLGDQRGAQQGVYQGVQQGQPGDGGLT